MDPNLSNGLRSVLSGFFGPNYNVNVWESVEHDWMVDNIATLAGTLQSFVQTYYISTYATVSSSLLPYETLMYLGLQVSPIYTEQVVKTGLANQFQTYWGDLNEGGKCSD